MSLTQVLRKREWKEKFLSTYFASVYELDVFNLCNILKKTIMSIMLLISILRLKEFKITCLISHWQVNSNVGKAH